MNIVPIAFCFDENLVEPSDIQDEIYLEKAFELGVNTLPEREMYLNTIITAPLDIKAQEKLLKF